ncbi:hypothetical protein M9434_000735 [Picochlorum sp. BPE23]|nr:hypothetical protein M9434_000735 [Picochlorum sp. BPE23]
MDPIPRSGRESASDFRQDVETLSNFLTKIQDQQKQMGDPQVPSGGYGLPGRHSLPGSGNTTNHHSYPYSGQGGGMGQDSFGNHGGMFRGSLPPGPLPPSTGGGYMYNSGHMYTNGSLGGYQPAMNNDAGQQHMRTRPWGGYMPRMPGHVSNSFGHSPGNTRDSTLNTSAGNEGAMGVTGNEGGLAVTGSERPLAMTGNERPMTATDREAAEMASKVSNLIDVCEEIARLDPYISVEMCHSLIQLKFPDFPSKDLTFGTLLGFYKTLRRCSDVPPQVMIVLETVWKAMTMSHIEKKVGLSSSGADDAAEYHPQVSESQGTTTMSEHQIKPPKRKRGRPRKNPDVPPPDPFANVVVIETRSGEKAVEIECNGKNGLFRLDAQTCDCFCGMCSLIKTHMGKQELRMAPREFERHAGMAHAKKWKTSIHLLVNGKRSKTLVKYLDKMGIEILPIQGPDDELVFKFAPPLGKGIASMVDHTMVPKIQEEREKMKKRALLSLGHAGTDQIVQGGVKESPLPVTVDQSPALPQAQMATTEKKSVGRPKKFNPNPQPAAQAIEKAEKEKASPIIQSWKCDPKTLNLYLNVSYGDAKYSGVLPLLGLAGDDDVSPQPALDALIQQEGQLLNVSPGSHSDESWKRSRQKEKLEEYQELLLRGPSKDSVCALCGLPGEEDPPASSKGFFGRSETGLGELTLVKMSAVSTAWVHDQCARWSPEVHDPTGQGLIVGVKDAVTRGRRLRCKHCQNKGATLGCFSKRCKSSYHLNCARDVCTYQMHPYLLFCPEHRSEFDELPIETITENTPDGPKTKSVRVQYDA